MGNIAEKDTYTCELCGFSEMWDETDDHNGDMWSCEVCGKVFCSKCLKETIGVSKYYEMMQSSEYIRCPDCFEKVEKELTRNAN